MQSETKSCQNCKNDFTIYDRDKSFYEKINVPHPTFCPQCRMFRRMAWRNVRSLHKRNCGICNKTIIAMYADDGVPVYCNDCWSGAGWDPQSFGRDYDFSRPFFSQFHDLMKVVPRYYQYRTGTLVNSDYTNYTMDNKNAYLSYSVIFCEDVMYSEAIDKSKNSIDCYAVQKLDGCSWNVDCEGNYNSHYCVQTQNSIDSYFLYDCANCQNCCLSSNLRNQQYVFNNQKLSKEEYQTAISQLKLDTYSGIENTKKEFRKLSETQAIHKFAQIYSSQNATGDYIGNAKDIFQSFDVHDSENVSYGTRVVAGTKDSYDLQGIGTGELIYEAVAASWGTFKDFFCYITLGCKECEYSLILRNCTNCFGCIGLTNAKFCIFNKQYSKEEYFETVSKIKQHMMDMPYTDKKGRIYKYGEFFPTELSFFGYNETNAHDFFPLKKEEAQANGYNWRDREKREYATTKKWNELPDCISDVDDSILNETIACQNNGNTDFMCTVAFRIMPDELQFYRLKKLPLPRKCPNCRHFERILLRNPMKLYNRECMCNDITHDHPIQCASKFETTYRPNSPEKIYCESCYQKSVL